MKIHYMPQKSVEWNQIRLGKITGSDFHILMGDSVTRKTKIFKKASEIITKQKCDADFYNIHIERGIFLEDEAREIYEVVSGNDVDCVGFVEADSMLGCSPDGLIGEHSGLEIKCFDNHTFLQSFVDNKIKNEHLIQIQFNMLICNRSQWDYFIYNKNYHKKIIRTIYRDDALQEKILQQIERAKKEILDIVNYYDQK